MTPTRLSLVILGFAVTCAVEMSNFTTGDEQNVTSSEDDAAEPLTTQSNIASGDASAANSTITTVLIITTINTTSVPSTNSTNSATNQTNATSNPSTTLATGLSSPDEENPITPKPGGTPTSIATTTENEKDPGTKTNVEASNSTGLIVLIVILILAAVFVAACCWTRRRGRRYSVDPTSQADGVNIPLSSVEPAEPPADPVPHNGLQTFESAESASNEPEVKPEVQEEQKAAEAVEPGADSASPAPAPDSSQDESREAAAEQGPPAPAEPDATDDEGLASAKTSAESVEGTNENNSNNGGLAATDLKGTSMFWDVPLHSPV